jgi:Mrp family chromosome partitioning ATPase
MDNEELELGHYGRIFRRSWWMIALAVAACVLLAWFFLPAPRDFYQSNVSVLLRPGQADVGRIQDPISEETEVGIAISPLIGSQVIEASEWPIDDPALDTWLENLLVSACLDTGALIVTTDCNSQILEFSYRADSAEASAGLVQLSAQTYLDFRINREDVLVQSQVDDLSTVLADLDLRIDRETQEFAAAEPDSVAATLSELRLRRLENEAFDVRSQLTAIESVRSDVGELLGDASTPIADSSGIPRPLALMAGALIGLLVGAFAATMSDRLDRRLSNAAEIESDLGVPVLGNIPRITEDSPALVTAVSSHTPGAEAFRRLAAAALAPRNGYVVDSITVTGATEKEGRTTAAVNMALALAQSGRHVLLVAGDRRNNAIDRLFGLTNNPGLNDFLRSSGDIDAARSMLAQSEERLGIRVVPTGTGSPPPLSSSALAALLAAANERNMMVVFDSPPALTHADGLQLSSIADAVYIVSALGKTRRSELNELRVQLLNVQADLAGAIINQSSRLSLLPAGAGEIGPGSVLVPTGVPGNSRSRDNDKESERRLESLHQMSSNGGAPNSLVNRSATPPQASPTSTLDEAVEFAEEIHDGGSGETL